MEASGVLTLVLKSLSLLCFLFSTCNGSYIITTPRQWIPGEKNQVCVNVPDTTAEAGVITLYMRTTDYNWQGRRNVTILPETTFEIPAGQIEACQQVTAPRRSDYHADLSLTGRVGGADLKETLDIDLKGTHNLTIIQTDKFLYEPGQEVKFRVLTIHGSMGQVVTDSYPEIWVSTQSRTRITQWMNVDNSAGLVHLSFQLADELEQGYYTISVRTSGRTLHKRVFKVEEYVLPRFEVKVTRPKFILASDEQFAVKVSAMYTYGQPVKGRVSFEVKNEMRRKCKAVLEKNVPIIGHRTFDIALSEMLIGECDVRFLKVRATVEEDGTGTKIAGEGATAKVTRQAIYFETVYQDTYKKPNLPFTIKVRATLPDQSPAAGLPIEVCSGGRCANLKTADDGLITAVVSGSANRIIMSTLNCRVGMKPTSFSSKLQYYYSPSNSSLLIYVPEGRLKCIPGQKTSYDLPVFFSANNQEKADLTVQIMSRGKVQMWAIHPVDLHPTPLPIDRSSMVDKPAYVPPPIVTGVVTVPITLPPTASPTVQVMVWYTREDGEVVSDMAQLEVEKCLGFSANLTWSPTQGEPGDATTLTVTAEPDAVCSIGVVDKSTELLNPDPDPVSLDNIFNYLDKFKIRPGVYSQVNDFRYCEKKMRAKKGSEALVPDDDVRPFRSTYYYSDYVDALKMFDDSGLYVLSDQIIETRPCEEDTYNFPWGFKGPSWERTKPKGHPFGTSESDKEPRTHFPETWLWELFTVPPTGLVRQLRLPGTITKWVGKAVCAHPEKGVGVSERASITSFTPFFSDLTLPPSVKRGEVLPVKISVFNYLDQPLPVRVTLEESPDFEVVEDDLDAGGRSPERKTTFEDDVDRDVAHKFVNLTGIEPLLSDLNDPACNNDRERRTATEEPRPRRTVNRGRGRDNENHPRGRGRDNVNHPRGRGRDNENHPRGRGWEDVNHPRGRSQRNENHPRGRGLEDENHPRGRGLEDVNHPRRRDRDDENHPRGRDRDDENQTRPKNQRTTCLGAKEKAVLTILIRPLVLGDVNLTVLALADDTIPGQCGRGGEEGVERSDTLIKSISVEAEGFKREITWNKYACAEELAKGDDSAGVWHVAPEEKIVPDSARGWVTVMGDLLALPLQNLGSLIRMPYGCGEQNMINFAPNIYIMQYLKATRQGTPETTEKLLGFMRMGYQRELLFRRQDGSFSIFGSKDSSGSTWLTAFVLKSFAQARNYITIDEEILRRMRNWLVGTAVDKRGCLQSVGVVFSKALQGGLTSDKSRMPLTAYVLIAIYESGLDVDNGTRSDLVQCLLSPSKRTKTDPYALALKAYALVLAEYPGAEEVVQELLRMATDLGLILFWKLEEAVGSHHARTVETAGYALLAMVALNPKKYAGEAKKIVQFVVSERNGDGGYYSTQDTVVALQALALYEQVFYEGSLDVVVTVTATAEDFAHAFKVTEANKLLQQRETLRVFPTSVSYTVEGRGCVVIQTVLRYNVPEAIPSNAFSLRINATNNAKKCALKHMEICSAYLLPDGASNMVGIEIRFVSGFAPPRDELERVVRENGEVLKRYEFKGNRLTFYASEFVTGKEFCVDFDVVREVEVKDAKPGIVNVYDYYEPEVAVNKEFEFPPTEGC